MELYGHNKPTFDAAYNMLKKYGECAIDQATGTGKTFICLLYTSPSPRDTR